MSDNNFATARDIGTLTGTKTLNDFVGKRDKNDFHKFTLSARSSLEISLKGLKANVDMSLFSAPTKGSLLFKLSRPGKKSEQVATTLNSGTYYLKINSADNRDTRYTLLTSATSLPTPTPTPIPTPTPTPTPTPLQPVSYYYGYGLVDASAAVARSIGRLPFPDVADSGYPERWALNKIKAPEVWNQGFRGQGVVVAVLDTGVNYANLYLSSRIWTNSGEIMGNGIDDDRNGFIDDTRGWDFTQNDNTPLDIDGHGTFISGILVDSLTGVAPEAKVMPVKVSADGIAYDREISDGIYYAVRNGANIINISQGQQEEPTPELKQAIQFARASNVLIVTSAGNYGDQGATQPVEPGFFTAFNDYGMTTGAIDQTGRFAAFSNPAGRRLDYVVAPGVEVYSDSLYSDGGTYGNGLTTDSGTSFSAPYVAGIAALMLSANPALTPAQIETYLTTTANFSGVTLP